MVHEGVCVCVCVSVCAVAHGDCRSNFPSSRSAK